MQAEHGCDLEHRRCAGDLRLMRGMGGVRTGLDSLRAGDITVHASCGVSCAGPVRVEDSQFCRPHHIRRGATVEVTRPPGRRACHGWVAGPLLVLLDRSGVVSAGTRTRRMRIHPWRGMGCGSWLDAPNGEGVLDRWEGTSTGVKIAGTGGVRAEVEPLRTRLTLSRGEL